jgi:hypothetical protein
MLRAVSLLASPSVLLFDVAEHPCNPNPAKITKLTASNNVLHFLFMVDIVVFTIDFLKRIKQAFLRIYKRISALYLVADKLMMTQHQRADPG